MRKIKLLVASLLATMLLITSGATSQAQSSGAATADDVGILASCTVGSSGDCTTPAVQAQGGNLVLDLLTSTWRPCLYRVRDTVNWQVVRENRFVGPWRETLDRVYSRYRLELRGCLTGSWGYIEG
jgi:hypothetical protein